MLRNIATCMENYGEEDGSEWGNNIVSRKAMQGPSGRVAYAGNVDLSAGRICFDEVSYACRSRIRSRKECILWCLGLRGRRRL